MMWEPTDALYKDVIAGLHGHPMSGLWHLQFESGAAAGIESGYGVRQLAACFGATEGKGDLLEKIRGKEIFYSVDVFGVLCAFTPVENAPQEMRDYYESQEVEP